MRKDEDGREWCDWQTWRIRTIDRVFRDARETGRRKKIEPAKEEKKLVFGDKEKAA